MHIRPLKNDSTGIDGEFTIDDLVIFSDSGQLGNVGRMWSAVTKYSLLMDRAHAGAIDGVQAFLTDRSQRQPASEDELDDLFMANLELRILSDSDSYLVKSMLFLLLVAFNEFAHKQVYKLVKPQGPALPPKGALKFITNGLKTAGIIGSVPRNYEAHFLNHIEPVRHNFAHGDWVELGRTLGSVDLRDSFSGVVEYYLVISQNLRDKGFDV